MTVEKINKWCDNCPHVACETCQITWTDIEELKKDIKDNYISKDKIREIIEELEKQEDWYIENKSLDDLYGKIDILKELLE